MAAKNKNVNNIHLRGVGDAAPYKYLLNYSTTPTVILQLRRVCGKLKRIKEW